MKTPFVLQEVVKIELRARQRNAGPSSPMFRNYMTDQGTRFLESRRAKVEGRGDGSGWAILECLDAAMRYGLPIPTWLSAAYQERFLSVKMGCLRHLEDGPEWGAGVFGKVPSVKERGASRDITQDDGRLMAVYCYFCCRYLDAEERGERWPSQSSLSADLADAWKADTTTAGATSDTIKKMFTKACKIFGNPRSGIPLGLRRQWEAKKKAGG
jgi:hypothetical protein